MQSRLHVEVIFEHGCRLCCTQDMRYIGIQREAVQNFDVQDYVQKAFPRPDQCGSARMPRLCLGIGVVVAVRMPCDVLAFSVKVRASIGKMMRSGRWVLCFTIFARTILIAQKTCLHL